MRRVPKRAWIVILSALGVIIPCATWYVVGSAAAEREAARVVALTRAQAQSVAHGLAGRIGGRLEGLRQAESRRPIYHYETHFHDPTSDCACASLTPSPLSRGPNDALIWTHFELDEYGTVHLPTEAIDAVDGSKSSAWQRAARSTREALAAAPETEEWQRELRLVKNKEPGEPVRFGLPAAESEAILPPMAWRLLHVRGEPQLAAVRRVSRAGEVRFQGFVVGTSKVNESLRGAYYPARCQLQNRDVAPDTLTLAAATLPLPGAPWEVVVDAGDALTRARIEAGEIQNRFRRTWGLVSLAVLAAGLAVMGLAWQSHRLARDRAFFAASAAHELRTPLAGLRLYADLLAGGFGAPEKREAYVRHVAAEAERLGRVVTNVLGYTRLERGSSAIAPRPGDLSEAVASCVERLRPVIESGGAAIELELEEPTPPVAFDRDAVFHIVQNLVDNAERHTREAEDRRVHVGVIKNGSGVELKVRDHGPGIPERVMERLFQPFVRGGKKGQPSGLGLGLTLVRELATAHGATVSVSQAPGGGALFTIWFPDAAHAA